MRMKLAFTVFAIIGLVGCGSKGRESTITGIVKYKGTPLITGYVLLQFDNGDSVNGSIAVDGSYSITTPFTGHAKVAVGSPKPVRNPDAEKRGGPTADLSKIPDPNKWVEIPAKYADPNTSGKEATIKGNDKIDIELD